MSHIHDSALMIMFFDLEMQTPNDRIIDNSRKSYVRSDLLVNSSIIDDQYRHTYRISNDPSLKNNYAPLNVMMKDTISTRNIHPVARYLDTSVPYYHDMLYNEKALNAIARGSNIQASDVTLDRVRLNGSPASIDRGVITSANVYPKTKQIDKMKMNEKHINNIMNVKSNIKAIDAEQSVQTAELKNNYPDNTYALESFRKPKFVIHKEGYRRENKDDTYIDQVYIQALEARAKAVCEYVRSNNVYSRWASSWSKMNKSLSQSGFTFSRLKETDADIAYTINKGEITRFRIRGKDYSYIPLNVAQYVLYHEMAHAANEKYGHGDEFCERLSILCLAAFELGFINLKNIKKEIYLTNEQPILCQADMKGEITRGIEYVIDANPELTSHYRELAKYVNGL